MVKTSTIPEAAITRILELDAANMTPTEIATILNKAGVMRLGGKTFARHHIRTIIDSRAPITPVAGPPPVARPKEPPLKNSAKTPEVLPVGWTPDKIDVDTRRLALPGSPPGVTTQTKREENIIDRIETLLDQEVSDYEKASPEEKPKILSNILRLVSAYDRTLVSAERAEATHSKVAQAIFILNHPRGALEGGPDLPDPGDDPLPSIFTQEARLYMEELGGTWEKFLERFKGE